MRRHRGLLAALLLLLSGWSEADAADLLPAERAIPDVVDAYVDAKLSESAVAPAGQADDATLIRRLTLDLAGRIPTTAESQAYVRSADPDKRSKLVERLMALPDFAYHQRNEFDSMLLPQAQDAPWRDYLLKAFRENRPWDNLFREIMLGREEVAAEKPALTFLRTRAANLDDLTNDTSALFFGVSINCAKCHDHPLVLDWTQDHYFGFSSFFNRTYLNKRNQLGEREEGLVKFKTKEGVEKEAKLLFLSGTVVDEPQPVSLSDEERKALAVKRKEDDEKKEGPAPPLPEFSRRAQLVELALRSEDNRFFSRSIVNRVWARLIGRGLVMPLDQMHSENPASHPELLDWLARDLVTQGYDLQRLIRGITLSRTYSRATRRQGEGDPPSEKLLAVGLLRPLTPAQYALSLNVASQNPDTFTPDIKPEEWAPRREGLESKTAAFAGLIEIPGDNFQVSVDEAMLFSNGSQLQNEFLQDAGEKLIGKLKAISDRKEMLQAAFRAVLCRDAEPEEFVELENYLAARGDRPLAALQQVVWSLLSSSEFRFNH